MFLSHVLVMRGDGCNSGADGLLARPLRVEGRFASCLSASLLSG
jgi:hypothetical protein